MPDMSHLDQHYFIDHQTFNCAFCNRNNVPFQLLGVVHFDWSNTKECYAYFTRCSYCRKISMHLSYDKLYTTYAHESITPITASKDVLTYRNSADFMRFEQSEVEVDDEGIRFPSIDLDDRIFYSQPSSFFTLDTRIPRVIRELITEAEGSLKMGFLTGASACMRKAVYELLILENCTEGKRSGPVVAG
jgi:hypothetical protein